ncbi:MAG: B12-binding domain-containing radical SAM protein [Oligoflexia bacterium]|nr:B12-binding domain-containing radical SAM protein [Oligoflexia bacterium]
MKDELIQTETELLTLTEASWKGFQSVEFQENPWRWAEHQQQSLEFSAKNTNQRIYYKFHLPIPHSSLTIRYKEETLLTLSNKNSSLLEGFFEFTTNIEEQVIFHFLFDKENSEQTHPDDPSLSYFVSRFILTDLPIENTYEKINSKLNIALVFLPAWPIFVPPMGVAYLAAAARSANFHTNVYDYNVIAWHLLQDQKVNDENLFTHNNSKYFRDQNLFEKHILPHLEKSMNDFAEEICSSKPDVIGFSTIYTSLPVMKSLLSACKKILPQVKIVCGGPEMNPAQVPSLLELIQNEAIDAIVIGEGEATFIEILKRWSNQKNLNGCKGCIHKLSSGHPVQEHSRHQLPFTDVPYPDFSDFKLHLYENPETLPVMMSRGCVARCAFCSETRFWQKFRFEPAERTFEHIKYLIQNFGIKKISFNDSLINGNFDTLSNLVDLILASNLKIKWMGQARVDKRMTKDLLLRMAQSGCEFLSYGFESGSQKVIDRMQKRTTVDLAKKVLRDSHEAGIKTNLNVIVGFPGEEEEDFQMTMNFVKQNLPYIWQIGINEMNIFVGIPVGDEPERFGLSAKIHHTGPDWETEDGKNTPVIRKDRIQRINQLIEDFGIQKGLGSSSM